MVGRTVVVRRTKQSGWREGRRTPGKMSSASPTWEPIYIQGVDLGGEMVFKRKTTKPSVCLLEISFTQTLNLFKMRAEEGARGCKVDGLKMQAGRRSRSRRGSRKEDQA